MSHFTAVETKVKDLDALEKCFVGLGFEVERSKFNLLTFKDYNGRLFTEGQSDVHEDDGGDTKNTGKPKKVCLVVRRKRGCKTTERWLAGQSEIGFEKMPDGSIKMHIDHMDLPDPEWVKVEKQLKASGKPYTHDARYKYQNSAAKNWGDVWKQKYAYEEVMAGIRAKGYSIQSEKTDAKQHIHLNIIKRG